MPDGKSILEFILLVVYPFGILLVGWWIKALKGAVEAQGKTIEAQGMTIKAQGAILTEFKDLSATMKGVLESTDEPKMLERLQAYKEIVDREKAAAITELKKQFAEGFRINVEAIKDLVDAEIEVFGRLVSYVPVEERRNLIDSLRLKGNPGLKDGLHKVAEVAADLSSPEKRAGLLALTGGIGLADLFREGPPKLPEPLEPGEKLKERMTKIEDKD